MNRFMYFLEGMNPMRMARVNRRQAIAAAIAGAAGVVISKVQPSIAMDPVAKVSKPTPDKAVGATIFVYDGQEVIGHIVSWTHRVDRQGNTSMVATVKFLNSKPIPSGQLVSFSAGKF